MSEKPRLENCLPLVSTFSWRLTDYFLTIYLLGSLHLAYFAAEVTLHRAIIRFDSRNIDDNLRSITRTAAKARFTSAIDLVNKFEPAHLQSFWYFSSKANLAVIGTFGSLLWATSDNPEEAEFYKAHLAEYRWTLRVSSKAAEFMKFTVGMLDASLVFVKDNVSKTNTPTVALDQVAQNDAPEESLSRDEPNSEVGGDQLNQGFNQQMYGMSEVSPSVGTSTENAYPYESEPVGSGIDTSNDTRPTWSGFPRNINFTSGDIQDWSLDQLYNFETFQATEDLLANRRFIEEYDETGNNFAGF
jgi:hypothetical protein